MAFNIRHLNYGTLSKKLRVATKAAALHPHLRLVVLLITFISLFAVVEIKDSSLPTMSSPVHGPSGDRAWEDLIVITQQPHPWNTRQNDHVRDYVLSEIKKGTK
jgi:hypothetical protein